MSIENVRLTLAAEIRLAQQEMAMMDAKLNSFVQALRALDMVSPNAESKKSSQINYPSSTASQYNQKTSSNTTNKKKRGRPAKSQSINSMIAQAAPTAVNAEIPPKKRGRPAKVQPAASPKAQAASSNNVAPEYPPVKKRGRPAKVKLADSTVSQEVEKSGAGIVTQTPKKRGRPAKVTLDASMKSQESDDSTLTVKEAAPKKRGRPAKGAKNAKPTGKSNAKPISTQTMQEKNVDMGQQQSGHKSSASSQKTSGIDVESQLNQVTPSFWQKLVTRSPKSLKELALEGCRELGIQPSKDITERFSERAEEGLSNFLQSGKIKEQGKGGARTFFVED